MNIQPVGDPIHHDFFSVVGTGIPGDAVMEFTTAVGAINVAPTFTRDHLALAARLPSTIPTGPATVRLTSPTTTASNAAAVTVLGGPAQTVRLLQPGETKPRPYTIVFVANPGIQTAAGATFTADPILANRVGYHTVVDHAYHNLFAVAEDLLSAGGMDSRFRIVSIFDATKPANSTNSLAHEIPASTTMETRRSVLAPFLSQYGVTADMVFVIHGSTTHIRASAWFTTDDAAQGGLSYSYDGVQRLHGFFPRIPGSAAVPVSVDTSGMTVLHEFGHAASDFVGGKVTDLYDDGGAGAGFLVNKKFRSLSSDPVPGTFSNYQGTNFNGDSARDGLGYPSTWRSYHAEPIDGSTPNLMDNYWQAPVDPQHCRFDQLTYQWFRDRLNAKLSR
jgi:hypothetical protein